MLFYLVIGWINIKLYLASNVLRRLLLMWILKQQQQIVLYSVSVCFTQMSGSHILLKPDNAKINNNFNCKNIILQTIISTTDVANNKNKNHTRGNMTTMTTKEREEKEVFNINVSINLKIAK